MGTPHHTQLHHEDCFLRLCSPCNGCGLEINWIVTGEETVACVPPGETINFNWEGPWHNVVEMGDDIPSYADCILDADETEAVEGPWSITLPDEGLFLFVCGVKTHCSAGNQKAEITVSKDC